MVMSPAETATSPPPCGYRPGGAVDSCYCSLLLSCAVGTGYILKQGKGPGTINCSLL